MPWRGGAAAVRGGRGRKVSCETTYSGETRNEGPAPRSRALPVKGNFIGKGTGFVLGIFVSKNNLQTASKQFVPKVHNLLYRVQVSVPTGTKPVHLVQDSVPVVQSL